MGIGTSPVQLMRGHSRPCRTANEKHKRSNKRLQRTGCCPPLIRSVALLPPHEDLQGSPDWHRDFPRAVNAGALPAAPPRPLPVGVGPSPRARRAGACAPSRLHPPSGLRGLRCCTPHAIFPHTTRPPCPAQAPVRPRRAPPQARRGRAAGPPRGLAPQQKKKKQKQKGVGVWGGGGGAFEPS